MPTAAELGYAQLDMGLVSPEDGSLANIARAISIQHLIDSNSGYLHDPEAFQERQERWERIAGLNPKHYDRVLSLMSGFDQARQTEVNDRVFYDEEILDRHGGSFSRFSPDSRAILRDILRTQVSPKGYRQYGREENGIYHKLGRARYGDFFGTTPFNKWKVHDLPYDEVKYPDLTSITPQEIIQAVLEGKLEGPNYQRPELQEAA